MNDKAEKKLPPEDYAKIAEVIGKLSDKAKAMRMAGLSSEAVQVLLKHKTGIPAYRIRQILEAAEDLKTWCLTVKKP